MLKYRNLKFGVISLSISLFVIGMVLLSFFFIQNGILKSGIEDSISTDLRSYSVDIDNKVASIASDVLLLEELIKNNNVFTFNGDDLEYTSLELKDNLEEDLFDWININNVYDQIRIIDTSGMEMIRVNYNQGSPTITAEVDLQNKAGRYYFTNAIDLADEYIYLSKLDLNIENSEIEYIDGVPKAMLRIASTIYNEEGKQIGLLIVNYLADNLFHDEETQSGQFSEFEVLNDEGYYLHSINPAKEFGFMFLDKEDEVFSTYHNYPIFEEDNIQIAQKAFEGEVYTSLLISNVKLSDSISERIGITVPIYSDNGDIIIFSEVDVRETAEFKSLLNNYIVFVIVGITFSFIITRLLDEITYQRKQQLVSLEYSSNHDVLTGLPNRNNVFNILDRMDDMNKAYTIMFLDFDGFKNVNDEYGHDIGDKVLIDGAKRIKNTIRESDIISRIGGDEFMIILPTATEQNVIDRVSQKIMDAIIKPFIYDKITCSIGVSIGVAIQDGTKITEEIIKLADERMYKIKKTKKLDL